jgi:hypothetical protein
MPLTRVQHACPAGSVEAEGIRVFCEEYLRKDYGDDLLGRHLLAHHKSAGVTVDQPPLAERDAADVKMPFRRRAWAGRYIRVVWMLGFKVRGQQSASRRGEMRHQVAVVVSTRPWLQGIGQPNSGRRSGGRGVPTSFPGGPALVRVGSDCPEARLLQGSSTLRTQRPEHENPPSRLARRSDPLASMKAPGHRTAFGRDLTSTGRVSSPQTVATNNG